MRPTNRFSATLLPFLILLGLAPITPTQAAPAAAEQDPYPAVTAAVAQRVKALNLPGASLVIVEGDQIVHAQGFGKTNPSPQTPFFIGSLTKSITALAVMQFVEADKITLDTPVQNYLPWFTLADENAAGQITIRHLLNQTSGIPQMPGMLSLANFDQDPGAVEAQARALADLTLTRPVGSAWEYSNVNFNLLGLVIEAVSGKSYTDYVQEAIFFPLEMTHSHAAKSAARQDGLALGHQLWFGFPIPVPDLPVPLGSLPSGQLIASAEDLGRYLIALLNDGRYGDTQILSPESIAALHNPGAEVNLMGLAKENYGMGWFIKETPQGKLIYHYGEVPDYFAFAGLLPDQARGFVLLVNGNHHLTTTALNALGEDIAALLGGGDEKGEAWGILPWVLRALLLLPIGQGVAMVLGARRLRRWERTPERLPKPFAFWVWGIAVPTAVNLLLMAIPVALLAFGLVPFSLLFMGDITMVLLLSGALALVWLCLRTPRALGAHRRRKTP